MDEDEPTGYAQGGGGRERGRKRRWLAQWGWFVLLVVVPVGLVAVYYGVVASDIYESESRFVIRAPNPKVANTGSLAGLLQGGGSGGGQDQVNTVLDFLRSRDALAGAQASVGIEKRYRKAGVDALSAFPGPLDRGAFEDLYRYYRKMVNASVDPDSNAAVLYVHAFTASDAQAINADLLRQGEALVNRLNARAQQTAIAEAQRRVSEAEGRVRDARLALTAYRNAHQLLDPAKQASGVLDVSNRLVAEQREAGARLALMQRMAPDNPAIPALQSQVVALGRQIAAQEGRAVGTQGGIASKLGQYEKLALDQEFASQTLNAANTALESARAEATRQQFYLERVVEPNRPDLALFPKRLKQIASFAAVMLCLYFVGWMLVIGIIEHAPDE